MYKAKRYVRRLLLLSISGIFIVPAGVFAAQPPAHIASTDQNGNAVSEYGSAISDDGRFAAFATDQSLISSDTNTKYDLYLKDLQTNQLWDVSQSVTEDPNASLAVSYDRSFSITGDGSLLAFTLRNSNQNITYIYNRITGSLSNPVYTGSGQNAALSRDGKWLVWSYGGFFSSPSAIYLYNVQTAQTSTISYSSSFYYAYRAAISGDGSRITFAATTNPYGRSTLWYYTLANGTFTDTGVQADEVDVSSQTGKYALLKPHNSQYYYLYNIDARKSSLSFDTPNIDFKSDDLIASSYKNNGQLYLRIIDLTDNRNYFVSQLADKPFFSLSIAKDANRIVYSYDPDYDNNTGQQRLHLYYQDFILDKTPPTIAITQPTNSYMHPSDLIHGVISDDVVGFQSQSFAGVGVRYSPGKGGPYRIMDATATCNQDRTSCTWTAPAPPETGQWTIQAFVQDLNGNKAQTAPKVINLFPENIPFLPFDLPLIQQAPVTEPPA